MWFVSLIKGDLLCFCFYSLFFRNRCLFIGLIVICVVKIYLLENHMFFHLRKKDRRPKLHTTLFSFFWCVTFSYALEKRNLNLDFCSFSFQPLGFGMSFSEITLASSTASPSVKVLLPYVIRNLVTILNCKFFGYNKHICIYL